MHFNMNVRVKLHFLWTHTFLTKPTIVSTEAVYTTMSCLTFLSICFCWLIRISSTQLCFGSQVQFYIIFFPLFSFQQEIGRKCSPFWFFYYCLGFISLHQKDSLWTWISSKVKPCFPFQLCTQGWHDLIMLFMLCVKYLESGLHCCPVVAGGLIPYSSIFLPSYWRFLSLDVSAFWGWSLFSKMEYGVMVWGIRKTKTYAAAQAGKLLIHSFPLAHNAISYWLFVSDSMKHFRYFAFIMA